MQELLPDADKELKAYLAYPLQATLASPDVADVVSDDFAQVRHVKRQYMPPLYIYPSDDKRN